VISFWLGLNVEGAKSYPKIKKNRLGERHLGGRVALGRFVGKIV
jgi:hypothetical protein